MHILYRKVPWYGGHVDDDIGTFECQDPPYLRKGGVKTNGDSEIAEGSVKHLQCATGDKVLRPVNMGFDIIMNAMLVDIRGQIVEPFAPLFGLTDENPGIQVPDELIQIFRNRLVYCLHPPVQKSFRLFNGGMPV
jgi:hypothetical protein